MAGEIVRYAELLPDEFRARLAARPIAYLPLGRSSGTESTFRLARMR